MRAPREIAAEMAKLDKSNAALLAEILKALGGLPKAMRESGLKPSVICGTLLTVYSANLAKKRKEREPVG
jgi:hypothetical protein